MRKLLAILFLFPLLCFGQSKTPLNKAFLQSNMDGNGLAITNLAYGPVQDVLCVVSDSRFDISGVPGTESWVQLLQRDTRFAGKYSLIDLAKSGDGFIGDLAKIATFGTVATNTAPSNVRKTVLIMLYINDSGNPLATTEAAALTFYNYWKTNGWRVIAGTDPGPIATANLLNFNTWLRTFPAGVDQVWDLATNTPLTYADGTHNDFAFHGILVTNFIANVLPQSVSGLRPMLMGAPNVYGPMNIYSSPNANAPELAVGLNMHSVIRIFKGAPIQFIGELPGFTNYPISFIQKDANDGLNFGTFGTTRVNIDGNGGVGINTNANYGSSPFLSVSKPAGDAFLQTIAGFVDQPGGAWKVLIGTNGNIMMFKGANVSSASTITPSGAIFHVTGTVTINTINLPFPGFTGSIYIIPDGVFATGTSGNIQIASTAVVSKQLIMTYDGTKWYPSY
jgi:hypothetical protein